MERGLISMLFFLRCSNTVPNRTTNQIEEVSCKKKCGKRIECTGSIVMSLIRDNGYIEFTGFVFINIKEYNKDSVGNSNPCHQSFPNY